MRVQSICSIRPFWRTVVLTAALWGAVGAQAHSDEEAVSQASALSALPVAMSVGAPLVLAAGASALTVVAVTAVAEGTVWVLQRASDGARFSVKVMSTAAGVASVGVGTVLTVTAVSAGWVISTSGAVLALIPTPLVQALLHHERVLR